MDILLTCVLIAVNAIFAVGAPLILYRNTKDYPDNALIIGQYGSLSLLGWGICLVMLTALILRLVKPSSWPDNPVYMYVTIALTLIGALLSIRYLRLEIRIKKDGLEIRTFFKRMTLYEYRDLEIKGKFSNQMVSISSRGEHLCTILAKSYAVSTMIRRWHDAIW